MRTSITLSGIILNIRILECMTFILSRHLISIIHLGFIKRGKSIVVSGVLHSRFIPKTYTHPLREVRFEVFLVYNLILQVFSQYIWAILWLSKQVARTHEFTYRTHSHYCFLQILLFLFIYQNLSLIPVDVLLLKVSKWLSQQHFARKSTISRSHTRIDEWTFIKDWVIRTVLGKFRNLSVNPFSPQHYQKG
jgi:hypothetical protein